MGANQSHHFPCPNNLALANAARVRVRAVGALGMAGQPCGLGGRRRLRGRDGHDAHNAVGGGQHTALDVDGFARVRALVHWPAKFMV